MMSWVLNDNMPVYLQIIKEIKRRIYMGVYKAGTKIPAVRELAIEASVNPNTMQRAMSELEREGLIFSERTTGRYVTEDIVMIENLKESFAKEIVKDLIYSLNSLGYTSSDIIKIVSSLV